MTTHELQVDLNEIVDTMVSDNSKQISDANSEITYGAASGIARLDIALSVLLPDAADDAQRIRLHAVILDRLVSEGTDWAVNYNETVVEALYRPAYKSAIDAGVDPAIVIAANCKLPLKTARGIARRFKKEDAAKAEQPTLDAEPTAEDAINTAPVVDPFKNDEDSQDS